MNKRRKYPDHSLDSGRLLHPVASQAIFILVLLGVLMLSLSLLIYQPVSAQIGQNTTVISEVNVTNAPPVILNVTLQNPIGLNANSTKFVTCNATIRDYNGFGDLSNVNATFFDSTYSSVNAPDANRTHYSNSSCSFVTNFDANTALYSCGFTVYYYANPYSWNCSVNVNDSYDVNDTRSNITNISVLIAISTPDVINYGDLPVLSTSADVAANVTNVGNRNVNLTLYGYNATPGDGLAMQCAQGNITYVNQRWALSNIAYAGMNVLNNTVPQIVPGLTIQQRNTTIANTINTTHWKLYVSAAGVPYGLCNGTIIFGGIQAN